MALDLAALATLLPSAIAWAESLAAEAAVTGAALSPADAELATAVGVRRPDLVRVKIVPQLPLPDEPAARSAALDAGLLGPTMIGLTLGYGIYIREGHLTARLLSHECRHVSQYETAGSIAAFLPVYLAQILTYG